MNKIKQNWQSHTSTIIGGLVAIATAWSTIDMSTFDINKDWKLLIIPAVIAIGGYMTKIKSNENNKIK